MRFSVLRRSITVFLEVGVWNRFVGFWVNAIGFSTALLLDFHQSGVLQFPQGVHRFLPPTMEQVNHFADRVIQENPSAVIRPPILAGQLCPAQDKGVQNLCLVGQGPECGGFKEEIREPGEAERLFRLMDIDGVCHSAFCGRLEAHFSGRTILYTTCPGLGLAEPDKSRLFSLLTVHSRPPFPFTFCFLPPVNSDGTAGAVFCPVGFGDEHAAADRTAFQVLIPENLRFQRSVQRQDRPAEPLTADRERNRLRAGAGVPIVKDNAVAVLTATALPAYQAGRLFPLRRCHAVKGTVRPALQWRQVFIEVISHAFPPFCFPLPFSPKRFPAPFLRRVPALARSSQLRDILSRSPTPCGASPAGVFLFGRSFCFQGAVHR